MNVSTLCVLVHTDTAIKTYNVSDHYISVVETFS